MTDWFLFLLPFFHHFSLISSRVTLLVERYISELFPIIETKHILKLKWIDIGFYIHTKEKWFYWNYICQTEAKWIGEKKHIQLETVRRATGRGSCTFRKLIFSEEISLLCVLCKIDANFFIISTSSIFHFTKTFLINHEIYRITCLIVAERTYFNLCSDKCHNKIIKHQKFHCCSMPIQVKVYCHQFSCVLLNYFGDNKTQLSRTLQHF